MIKFPEEFTNIVKEANARHASDMDAAVAEASQHIHSLRNFNSLVSSMVEKGIRRTIAEDRHAVNRGIKYHAGVYTQKPKVVVGKSNAVMRAAYSVLDYRMAGTTLGELNRKQLLEIAGHEKLKAEGHHFNERLCGLVAAEIPDNKKVKNALTATKLRKLFLKSKGEQEENTDEAA